MDMAHRDIRVNGVRLHIAEQGSGPLVLLLHGFPEGWYSWRYQLTALAEAGYRVVAPDQRGYGRSDRPKEVSDYSLPHLVGDVVALIDALGEERAVVVGHDWGAPVAWATALMRPDLVRGVVGLSVPPAPPAMMPPPSVTRKLYGEGYYQVYFQEPGRADAEMAADPVRFLRRLLAGGSGDKPGVDEPGLWMIPEGTTAVDSLPEPETLPGWLTEDAVRFFAREHALHKEHAYTGPLNWYRNIEANQGLMSPFRGRTIDVPGLYMVGTMDLVLAMRGVPELRAALTSIVPDLRGDVTLPGCGHWTQQERPEEVNAALLEFLAGLD
ncbi:alpha/beta fold hydrolase [Nocardiopsis changdeensis]|uniref:Alpha/beta hydrolase n=1 Tax=Nocardiopsis changdeensis TaxID=2831969 RepID=A0ABX8BTB9_9ACTN|nr:MULTISPECIES: alpha/beta hydrolase [Nocardiopsis]QUX24352.1 alpha/beta hydrolase [Nocardiopsis changdeensis]QYX34743.1 alpha/beta hydrolase [Nocardiopsis sp. MT53]